MLLLLASSDVALTSPAPAPSLATESQPSVCGNYLNIRPDPAADLPDQRAALMSLFSAVSHQALAGSEAQSDRL